MASSELSARIDAQRGGGKSLDAGNRGSKEGARVSSLDVFVRSGQSAPGGSSTQPLLVHELTHVRQQCSKTGDGGDVSVGAVNTAEQRKAEAVAYGMWRVRPKTPSRSHSS